jgi:tellurite resistance protein
MTRTDPAGASLAILVSGLAEFLREQQKLQNPILPGPFPEELARVFEISGHHLVALVLVARSDDEVVATERQTIVRHCTDRAEKAGVELSSMEKAALYDYLRHFRPTLIQFISAMERLNHDTKNEIADLIAAARAVVEADGVVRLQEALYLTSLERELLAL